MDIKLSQLLQEVDQIKKGLAVIIGDDTRVKGSVEFVNLKVKYHFPNTLNLTLPKGANEISITGEGPDWVGQIRAKLARLRQGV